MVIILELKRYLDNLFLRVIIALFLLITVSFTLKNNYSYENIYNVIYYDPIDFAYINSKLHFLLGNIIHHDDMYVTSIKLKYKDITKYNNSYKISTDYNLVINNINPGVVTFIGEIEDLGYTVIVSGDNNIDYWYSNIENVSVSLYDHISSEILGSTIDDYLILTIKEDEKYLDYEGLI